MINTGYVYDKKYSPIDVFETIVMAFMKNIDYSTNQ